jgi:hypothetical protein
MCVGWLIRPPQSQKTPVFRRGPSFGWLRRTAATGLARLGTPRLIIGKVLNHSDRSVTGIYDRFEYLDEKREALESWSRYIAKIIG